MSKALVLGAVALAFSAATASAQVYATPDYGYGHATPVADLAPPPYGYAAPGYGYAAPPYAAPATAGTTVVIVTPAPGYAAPPVYAAPQIYSAPAVTSGYYDAPPVPPEPIYDYAPGYRGGYGYAWR